MNILVNFTLLPFCEKRVFGISFVRGPTYTGHPEPNGWGQDLFTEMNTVLIRNWKTWRYKDDHDDKGRLYGKGKDIGDE